MKLGIGIVGLGEGRSTMSAVLNSSIMDLIQVCDTNEDLCKQRALEFNFQNYTTSFEDLLNNPSIRIIAIYTPDHLHAEHIKKALEARKHVVCTKPLLNDLKKAKELLDLQVKYGKQVFVGQSSRFFEPMMLQRKDYLAGKLGELITVEASYNADHRWFLEKPWARQETFKWLFGGLSHPVDLIRWYLPAIEEVMGYGSISRNGLESGLKNEDSMHFIFKNSEGQTARVSGSYSGPVQPASRASEMTCILRGTRGSSQADYPELRYAISDDKEATTLLTFDHKSKYYFRFEGRSHHAGEYQNYLEYFVKCIDDNKMAYPDLTEGIETIAVLVAMEKSLRVGQPVKITDVLKSYGIEI